MNSKHRIQNFWKYFLTIKKDLEYAVQEDPREFQFLLKDINERLKTICGCPVEIELSETDFFEMTFDTAGNKNAQLCSALLKKEAPQELREDWIINAYRQPLSDKAIHSYFDVDGVTYTGADFTVYYTIEEASATLALKIYCKGLLAFDEERRQNIVAYMLELFLGELELEARISSVEILEEPCDDENVCILPNLYEDICDMIIDQDWVEYQDPLSIYTAYKLDEKPVSETLRNDRKLIITTNAPLQEELMRKEDYMCRDFSALGGVYGFLYYEVNYEDEKEALLRQQLEKEINDLLYDMSIARTMGGAVGVYYSYIDVAVFDIDGFKIALEKINEHVSFPIYFKEYL